MTQPTITKIENGKIVLPKKLPIVSPKEFLKRY